MRITKKFAGSNGIGKQVFSPTIETEKTLEMRRTLEREIEELEKRFFKRIDNSLVQQALLTPKRSFSSVPGLSDYRVALPSERADPFFTNYKSLLNFVNNKKTIANVDSTVVSSAAATLEKSKPSVQSVHSQNVVPVSKPGSGNKPPVKTLKKPEPGFIDEAYRVHGFEVSRNVISKNLPLSPKDKIVSPVMLTQREKEKGKVHVNKKYHVASAESQVAPSTGNKGFGTMAIDPSIDLHASALLLDFFRAARDKESYSEENSNGKREGVHVDDNYRILDDDVHEVKRKKMVSTGL